jgi:HNH endonuclease
VKKRGRRTKPLCFEINERGCFICTSHSSCQGYPQRHRRIGNLSIRERLHRVIYEECFGLVPAGLHVLHNCDEPACINPEHLRVGTHADNMRDTVLRNRRPSQVTPELVRTLRAMPVGEVRRHGAAMGLKLHHVWEIRTGKRWGHIEGAVPVKRRAARDTP